MPGPYAEFWAKITCPDCKTVNWVYTGHSQVDVAYIDATGFKCFHCAKTFAWMHGEDEKFPGEHANPFPEDGQRTPDGLQLIGDA